MLLIIVEYFDFYSNLKILMNPSADDGGDRFHVTASSQRISIGLEMLGIKWWDNFRFFIVESGRRDSGGESELDDVSAGREREAARERQQVPCIEDSAAEGCEGEISRRQRVDGRVGG